MGSLQGMWWGWLMLGLAPGDTLYMGKKARYPPIPAFAEHFATLRAASLPNAKAVPQGGGRAEGRGRGADSRN